MLRGGGEWEPQFIESIDESKCIGCGRCYKVCSRDVFNLVERGEVDDDDDYYDEDDVMMVMNVNNPLDCIGCMSCAKVCSKGCHGFIPASQAG
ncbi:ferredoxin III, nif-specific [Vibrio sp. PP-XX7]